MNNANHTSGGKTILTLFFILISAAIIHLVMSDQLIKYVHPRYKPFIVITVIICVLIAISLILSKRTIYRASAFKTAILALPVILLAFTNSSIGRYSDLPQRNPSSSADSGYSDNGIPESVMKARESSKIIFSDSFSFLVLQDIYDNPQLYKGKEISMKGIVMRQKKVDDLDEFAIIRMMMTCCAADLQPIGFVCRYEKSSLITSTAWYKIEGNIMILDKQGGVPIVSVTAFSREEKPEQEYIYPF